MHSHDLDSKDKDDFDSNPAEDPPVEEMDVDSDSDFQVVENPVKPQEVESKPVAIDLEIPILTYLQNLQIDI